MVPLLELQRRQQMATLYFVLKGPSLLKCSMVAPEAAIACGLCFITIWQYTQVLSLARISRSSCLEIPYVLDMVFGASTPDHLRGLCSCPFSNFYFQSAVVMAHPQRI